MNRRQFLRGATTAAVVAAVPIAAVGQQERYLVEKLGLPAAAQEVSEAEDWVGTYSHDWGQAGQVTQQVMYGMLGAFVAAKGNEMGRAKALEPA